MAIAKLFALNPNAKKRIKVIPNANLRVSKDSVICALHWPSRFEEIKFNEKNRSKDLPTIWSGVTSVKYRHHHHH